MAQSSPKKNESREIISRDLFNNPNRKKFSRDSKYFLRDDHGKIIDKDLPPRYKAIIKARKVLRSKRTLVRNKSLIRTKDDKVYLNKYYPWCYKNFKPTMVLQGWYDRKSAKIIYKLLYGPDALKYVRFIKGKKALERGFDTGRTLYINGRWELVRKKVIVPRELLGELGRLTNSRRVFSRNIMRGINPDLPNYKKEKILVDQVQKAFGGGKDIIIPKIGRKKIIKLQEVQKIIETRKKSLYEE